MKTPILGGYAVARSTNAADNRLMNLYPEATPEGGKTAGFLTRCPGIKNLISVGSGPIRGLWQFGGYMYVVSGVELYKVTNEWVATLLGTVSGSGPVSMSDNGDQLFIACNPRGYTYSAVSNTFAEITDPDFPGAVTVGFINGYFVFNEPNSQKLWITSYQDGSSVDPLEFSYADANPDNLLSLVVNRNEIWLFGSTSTEVWYYSGDVDFPLARIQGAFNEVGCAASYSPAKLDNTIYWLGSDPRGNAVVYKAVGYGAQRVSTHGIEKVLQSYSYVGDAIGYSYQQEGHTFYVLTFPTANATWCYDAATQEWHERGSWSQGAYLRHRSNCQVNFNNKIIVGDYQFANLFEFDLNYYKDDIGIQRWVRSWRALPPNENNLNRTAHHSLQLDVETGGNTIRRLVGQETPAIAQTFIATFNPIRSSSQLSFEDNYTTVYRSVSAIYTWSSACSKKSWNRGKKYFEVKYNIKEAGVPLIVGVGETVCSGNQFIGGINNNVISGTNSNSAGYMFDSGGVFSSPSNPVYSRGSVINDLSAYGDASQGDIIMVAMYLPEPTNWMSNITGTLWVGRNGTWFNGDPSTMTGGDSFSAIYPYTPDITAWVSLYYTASATRLNVNMGASAFQYSIPTGFTKWDQGSAGYGALDPLLKDKKTTPPVVGNINISDPYQNASINYYAVCGRSLLSAMSGKVYFEYKFYYWLPPLGDFHSSSIGLGESGMDFNAELGQAISPFPPNYQHQSVRFFPTPTSPNIAYDACNYSPPSTYSYSNGTVNTPGLDVNERGMMAIDFDAGKVWIGSAGVWSGDPEAGTGEAWNFTPNTEMYIYGSAGGPGSGSVLYSNDVYVYTQPSQMTYSLPLGFGVMGNPNPTLIYDDVAPKVLLRWSDDGGHTWSNYYEREMGLQGEYWTRVIWRRLGMTTKLRDRIYEISGSDETKITITGAELMLSGTTS